MSRISAKQNSRLNNHSKGLLKLVLNETSEFTPATQSELVRFVAANSVGDRKTLCPVGGRTSLRGRSADVNVSLTELSRVIDYPARDMTITVEAGIRVDTLQSMLAAERQRLPIDIPQSGRATLGGALATNTSGPRRFGHGTFRDYVIGVSAVDASGRLFKAGGRVVKNVAGYDICKLMIGSYGTVGIVTQVTLKLRPFTETTAWFIVRVSNYADAEMLLARLLKSESRPVAIDVLDNVAGEHIAAAARIRIDSPGPYLCIAFEGSPHEVQWQLEMIEREMSASGVAAGEQFFTEDADRLWAALTEFQTCADDPLTFKANLLPSRCMEFAEQCSKQGIALQIHAGNGIVIGQLPQESATLERTKRIVSELQYLARSHAGNLIVLHCDPEWEPQLPMFGIEEPSWRMMSKLKQTLDPQGLLNPGQPPQAVCARRTSG